MTSWKRLLVDRVTRPFGIQISRVGSAWVLIEPEQLQRFLTTFHVDCVFDVGANVGQYARRLRLIGFNGLIVSFEPIPDAAEQLRQLARNDDRWIVKEVALDEQSRRTNFQIMRASEFSSLHEPDHSVDQTVVDMNTVEQRISIETETISDLFPVLQKEYGFKRPFLKMDTQGHDVPVARGAGCT